MPAGDGQDCVSVYLTAPDRETALALADALVGERLAACVNVVPGVTSVYRWEGRLTRGDELVLFAKTRRARVGALLERVVALHPDEVPCAVVLPLVDGHGPYLHWVGEQVGEEPPAG